MIPSRMRRALALPLVLPLLLAVSLAGCSSAGSATDADELLTTRLELALLTLADLPEGWSAMASPDLEVPVTVSRGPADCARFFDMNAEGSIVPNAWAAVLFSRGTEGPVLGNMAGRYAAEADAERMFGAYEGLIEDCARVDIVYQGQTLRVTLEQIPVADPSANSIAFRGTMRVPGGDTTVEMISVVAHRGASIVLTTAQGVDGAVPADRLAGWNATALDRVAATVDG